MLVTRVLGDCPACGGKNRFGNVSVGDGQVLRGCMSCSHRETVWLPETRKQILYLDQFFFSNAFKERDPRFISAADRIRKVSASQLISVPYSSIHEDETHQWRGYDGKDKDDLMEFIKATSRGYEFEPSYDVEQRQLMKAFQAFLQGQSPTYDLQESDAIPGNIHEWDDYFRIDVGRYINDIELIRSLKQQGVEQLVDAFPGWRESMNSFEQDVEVELRSAAQTYIDSSKDYIARLVSGDYASFLDSPIISMFIPTLMQHLPAGMTLDEGMAKVVGFFESEHFSEIPYQWLRASIFAFLKDMVKRGAYTNRERAIQRLGGFFHDIKHVSTYAPYCDAFVLDNAMAEIITDPRINLEARYGVKVFSLNNWEYFNEYLDALEAGMSQGHRTGLAAAYP